jgi:hypothetical protein
MDMTITVTNGDKNTRRELYQQVEPLYLQLHAYVRRRLYETYGPTVVDLKGPLLAHLVGDMWGRFWSDLGDIVRPYPIIKHRWILLRP